MKNYSITLTIVGWIDVFTCKEYAVLFRNDLKFWQERRGLKLHAWVIMSNRVHLVISCRQDRLDGFLKEFKKYTSRNLVERIGRNRDDQRWDWLMHMLSYFGKYSRENSNFQFWMDAEKVEEPEGRGGLSKMIESVLHIPVKEGIVAKPEHYVYSSASNEAAFSKVV